MDPKMNWNNFIYNNLLKLKVNPNSKRIELIEKEGKLRLYLKAIPEKGKANQELVKFFKKKYGLKVKIIKGEKSKEKVLKIIR